VDDRLGEMRSDFVFAWGRGWWRDLETSAGEVNVDVECMSDLPAACLPAKAG
jgi:hypothetical protein